GARSERVADPRRRRRRDHADPDRRARDVDLSPPGARAPIAPRAPRSRPRIPDDPLADDRAGPAGVGGRPPQAPRVPGPGRGSAQSLVARLLARAAIQRLLL